MKTQTSRDYRYDLFRGIALIAIALNHIAPPLAIIEQFGHYQLRSGLSFSFAAVFIFISGCVAGIAYWKSLVRDGQRRLWKKATIRCIQIFYYNAATSAACLVIIGAFYLLGVTSTTHQVPEQALWKSFLGTIFLFNPLPLFNILGIYIVFLLVLPIYLSIYRRIPAAAIGSCFMLYMAMQAQYFFDLKNEQFSGAFFAHPLAWQLLFFIGVSIGVESVKRSFTVPKCALGVVGAILYLIAIDYLHQLEFAYFHFNSKEYLGPLRVTDILVATYLVYTLAPKELGNRLAYVKPLVSLGKNSLPVFCIGILISYTLSYSLHLFNASRALYLIAIVTGAGLLLWLGMQLSHNANLERRINP